MGAGSRSIAAPCISGRASCGGRDAAEVTGGWFRLAPGVFLLLWSTGFPVASIGLAHAEPLTLLALRYALVLLALLPLLALWRPPLPRTGAAWLHLAVVGALVQFGYFALNWMALSCGAGVGAAALIASLQPVLVALLAPALGGPRIGGRVWAGLALGLAGAGLVIAARFGVSAPSAAGLALAAGSLLCMTAGTLYEKRFGAGAHPLTAAAMHHAVACAAALGLAVLTEGMRVAWSPGFAGALLYLVVANSLLAMSLLLAMIRRGEVARVSALFFLVPPLAAVMAWLLQGEGLPPLAWAGMALAAAGVALATRTPHTRT